MSTAPAQTPPVDRPSEEQIAAALAVLAKLDPVEMQRHGYHLVPAHYYTAMADLGFLDANRDLWERKVVPPDIEWDWEGMLRVAAEVARSVPELRELPKTREPGWSRGEVFFAWDNPFWGRADAIVQYGLVRVRQPRRYVEIGCGWSSLLLAEALRRNERETRVTQIEPYPNPVIFKHLPETWTHHETIVQRAPMSVFEELEDGDMLFYDGSHCCRTGSDVNWMIFDVLPRLKKGVLIHFHDICWPFDYPRPYLFKRQWTWSEQFVLQALLMNSSAYKVEIANNMLAFCRKDEVERLYGGVAPIGGGSVWIRKIADPAASRGG